MCLAAWGNFQPPYFIAVCAHKQVIAHDIIGMPGVLEDSSLLHAAFDVPSLRRPCASHPPNLANTCNLCLYRSYLLIMLQQSGIVTRAGSCDKTRCAQILSDSFASMTIEACQNQPTVSFHYLGGFGMQRPKDIRLS